MSALQWSSLRVSSEGLNTKLLKTSGKKSFPELGNQLIWVGNRVRALARQGTFLIISNVLKYSFLFLFMCTCVCVCLCEGIPHIEGALGGEISALDSPKARIIGGYEQPDLNSGN